MGLWTVVAMIGGAIVLGIVAFLVRRGSAERYVAGGARPSKPPWRPEGRPAPSAEPLPPHRIVLAADGVPVIDVARMRTDASIREGSKPLDAPRLASLLAPVARESRGLMELPGADRCRVHVRVEVARAMKNGILPLLLSKSPVAPITGEGVETLAADPAMLAELGLAVWEAACAEHVRRVLANLEGHLSVLAGGATNDAVAAIRARRADLLELGRRIATGETGRERGTGLLEEVEASSRARTDDLLRQLSTLPATTEDAALRLRQVAGSLLVLVSLRAAAVEVRCLLHHNPDRALPKLIELEALLSKIEILVSGRRTPLVEDTALDLLAQGRDTETILKASKERLYAREIELQIEVAPSGALGNVFLG